MYKLLRSFDNMKIRSKLLFGILTFVALAFLITTWSLTSKSSQLLEEGTMREARKMAESYSYSSKEDIENAMSTARVIANLNENIVKIDKAGRRKVILDQLEMFIAKNPKFLAVWVTWEPEALDGPDKLFIGKPGANSTGRFSATCIMENGSPKFSPAENDDVINTSDWYTLPKTSKTEIVLDPYFYSYTGDKKDEILMTSVIVPIMRGGTFLGAAGIDISLEEIQKKISAVKPYETGFASILSNAGSYIAAKNKEMLGKKMGDIDHFAGNDNDSRDIIEKTISEGKELIVRKYDKADDAYYQTVYLPFTIGNTKTPWSMCISIPENKITAPITEMRYYGTAWALIALLFLAGVLIYITGRITKSLNPTLKMMSDLGKARLSTRVKVESNDELGVMSNEMNLMAEALQGYTQIMYKVADGDLNVEVTTIDDRDEISPALKKIVSSLRELKGETDKLTRAALDGNLSIRGNADKFSGGYKEIISGINSTLDAVILPIKEGAKVLSVLAKKDLTLKMEGDFKGDHQIIMNSINTVADSLNNALLNVKDAVSATSGASAEIASNAEDLSSGVQTQSSQVEEIAGAVEQMTKTISETSMNISLVAENSKKANISAENGTKKTIEAKKGMEDILKSASETGRIITSLVNKTDQIGQVSMVINDIADQTNLLALNAAIEAARAGEQGRGFAVVADEVRKLAERTSKATKEIGETIKIIQSEAKEADSSMSLAQKSVKTGVAITEEVTLVLSEIQNMNRKVADMIHQVAAASEEQTAAAEEISKSIENINSVIHNSASSTKGIARSAEDLSRLMGNLENLVQQFKLANHNGLMIR